MLFREKMAAQAAQCVFFACGVYEYGYVVVAASVGYHAHGHSFERRENVHTAFVLNDIVPDYGNDGLSLVYRNYAEFAEFGHYAREIRFVFDGQRYGYFRGGYHVYRSAVTLEYLENAAQKTVCQKHPCRLYLYGRDAVFGRYGLYASFSIVRTYQSAVGRRVHSVFEPYGYSCVVRRDDTQWMQYFSSEIGKLLGFAV